MNTPTGWNWLKRLASARWVADIGLWSVRYNALPRARCSAYVLSMVTRAYKGDETTGFQSPAQDHSEAVPDLADFLKLRRPQSFAGRVKGYGLRKRGIHSGDILVVNTDAEPRTGKVCVAFLHGDVVLAVLSERDGEWWLEPSSQPAQLVSGAAEVWVT